jgi:toxin ParE1/3/4
MPRVDLSPRADDDLRGIWNFTADTWSEEQAERYVDDLIDAMEALAADPTRGRTAHELSIGLRRHRCASHVIFYREVTGGVRIVRVLHSSMDFAAHLANDEEP